MAETIQNTDNLLDLTKITEPFDLASALRYMKENGEFIRCKNVSDDFYMYRDVQKRPVIVNGRRQLKDVENRLGVQPVGWYNRNNQRRRSVES
ncbi:Uncharacterised protein [Streptococcus pneumoniae]|nr:Uncharacterised protein [Streptococcus pneumoniae]